MDSSSNKQAIIIGIFGSNGKTSTASLLNSMFYEAGLSTTILNHHNIADSNKKLTNIEVHNKLKKLAKNDIIIIEITKEFLINESLKGVIFNILIHCHISEGSYEDSFDGISKINSIINCSYGEKCVILNTDDTRWKDIVIDLENTYLITYGLSNKATVTASSIESSKNIKFCYCLQRSIPAYNDGLIEPMELPIVIKAPGHYNVYNGLASITAALICGICTNTIQYSLNKNIIQNTGIKILYENGFGVVDNICDTILGFETGFETIQNFNYDNVHLVFDLNSRHSQEINRKILETIGSWSMILSVKKIYYIENKDGMQGTEVINTLKDLVNNSETPIYKIEGNTEDVACIINSLRKKDILLIFCSSMLKDFRECIIETLDKLILGEL